MRRLLERVREGMEPGSEMASALDSVLEDPERLETIGLSVVQFIELMVCKHYRILASRLAREQQLKGFLQGELAQAEGGRLWSYLQHAQTERRHAVLIVVDGLQGHLVEALVSADRQSPFVRQILREQREGEAGLRPTANDAPDLEQQTEFLAQLPRR